MSLESFIIGIKEDEGFSGKPYKCTAGATTIGYGRNLDANPLTEEEGEYLLRRDVIACIADVIDLIGSGVWAGIGVWRQAALVNMRYQLGWAGLRGFERMLAAVRLKDWNQAAHHALDSLWAQQTPSRARRVAFALLNNENTWR